MLSNTSGPEENFESHFGSLLVERVDGNAKVAAWLESSELETVFIAGSKPHRAQAASWH